MYKINRKDKNKTIDKLIINTKYKTNKTSKNTNNTLLIKIAYKNKTNKTNEKL